MIQSQNMTDYEKTYQEFEYEVPEYFNFAGDVIDSWAQDPDKLAMLWVDEAGTEIKKTFSDLSRASKQLANLLAQKGVKQKDVVMLVLPRNIEWWEAMTACIRMGALVAPGTTQLTAKDLEYRANRAEATCIITNHEIAAKFDEVADKCPTVKTKIAIAEPRKGWLSYTEEVKKASDRFETADTRSNNNCLVYFTSGTVSGFAPGGDLVKELQDHVKKVTAPYKYPRKIEFVEALPKTVSGKIRRVQLRKTEWGE